MMSKSTTLDDLTIEPVSRIPESAEVRHVDQLSERAREQFLTLVEQDPTAEPPSQDLIESDVIVFNDTVEVSSS